MATAQADYAGFAGTTYPADTYDEISRALQGLAAIFRAKLKVGTEPNDNLIAIELGDAVSHNKMALAFDGANFVIRQNTGTEATPIWTDHVGVDIATGTLTLYNGNLSVAGTVDLTGGAVSNAGAINGVSISAHASRHQPGGADPLVTATASDIGSANAAGVATSISRSDHVHRGVRSFNSAFGDITGVNTISAGTGITVSGTSAVTVTSAQRAYAFYDGTPGDIVCSATTPTAIGGFVNLAIPGSDSAAEYLIEFTAALTTASGAETTAFRIHVGTLGTVSDAEIAMVTVESLAAGDTPTVQMRGIATNATSSQRVTVSYDSGTGSRHTIEGSSAQHSVLTMIRLTGVTSH